MNVFSNRPEAASLNTAQSTVRFNPASSSSLTERSLQMAGDRLAVAADPSLVKVAAKDALVITAKAGDTYWGLARRFAATLNAEGSPTASEINAYVADLQALNGKFLKAGQTVKLPRTENATWKLEALAVAQKDIASRQQAGETLPAFDWTKAEVAWGYAEAMEVTLSPVQGGTPERLAIHATARDTYSVQSLADYYRRNGLAE